MHESGESYEKKEIEKILYSCHALSAYCVDCYRRPSRLFFFFQAEDGIRDKLVTGVQTCALPIFTLPSFGDEKAIAETLRMADLGVPVLIHAFPDAPGQMTIRDRRDSFCGKMSACNNLQQFGIRYSLTTLHTESPASDTFRNDIDWFAAVCRTADGRRGLRIGAIGARPAAFNTV